MTAEPARPPSSLDADIQANTRTLSDADVEAIADALKASVLGLVERLAGQSTTGTPPARVGVAEVARRYGVSTSWVYHHADELGAIRLGNGPRARLRFDLERVDEAMTSSSGSKRSDTPASPGAERKSGRRRPRRLGTNAPLLPIQGESPCP